MHEEKLFKAFIFFPLAPIPLTHHFHFVIDCVTDPGLKKTRFLKKIFRFRVLKVFWFSVQ